MDNAAKTPLEEVPALAQLLRAGGEEQTLGALAGLLDTLPVGVALLDGRDDQLRLLYLNSPAQRFTSRPREAVLGQPAARALDELKLLRALREARRDRGSRRVRYRTGEGLWDFEAVSLDAGSGQPARLLASWEPVREEAPAVDAAIDAARRLQVGVDVALEVAARLEPEEVVERILRRALEAVEADRATLGRMEGGFECTILGSVDRTEDRAPIGRTISLESQDPVVEAMATRRPVLGHLAYERVGMRPLRWDLVIPLVVGGELVALLGVSRDRRQFDEDEIAVLQQIGAVAALAFRNATLFQSLREASRIRSQFLNMAAHELRTPLSVIGGYASMLADGTLGEAPQSWRMPLAVVVEKTKELAHLIDDILLAGRLDSGVARTSGRSMDLGAALRDATQRAAARAKLLDARLKVDQPQESVHVWGDPDHVARILDNLVNNAFNYSPKQAEVSITSEISEDWAVVRVEDHGRGISEEHRDHIFQQFYRVEDPKDGYPPGTGLGLFISRALAERYGGNLDLEWSEPGQGSRFALRLPLSEAAA